MEKIENGWTSTLKAMTECLKERQQFIEGLIADIVVLEWENKKLAGLVKLLTTERVESC
jgi:hypothetical protein